MYDKLWEFLNEMDICMFIILFVFFELLKYLWVWIYYKEINMICKYLLKDLIVFFRYVIEINGFLS